MRIGDLAKKAGCDVQTVRYYEREGLLDEPRRDASNYRSYASEHLARLHFIRHCRSLHIPLAEVRQYIAFAATPSSSCGAVDALLDRHIDSIRQQVKALGTLERQLVALRGECAGGQGASCGILETFVSAAASSCACHPLPGRAAAASTAPGTSAAGDASSPSRRRARAPAAAPRSTPAPRTTAPSAGRARNPPAP